MKFMLHKIEKFMLYKIEHTVKIKNIKDETEFTTIKGLIKLKVHDNKVHVV